MKKCQVCQNQIKKGEEIAVFAYPIKSLSNDGEYSLIGEFLKKEKIVHFDCFKDDKIHRIIGENPKPCRSIDIPRKNENKIDRREFYSLLKDMGEKVNLRQVIEFISSGNFRNIEEAVLGWFKKR